ncbi:protein Dok-7 [Cololabis saira]|uniref:protein Dok-7 n=1 Tax=Cololabis saira TaxID=129043 RepID=UPI002AD27E6B|nr:protein Dok-7 [Cololabis saira]
MTDSVVAEGQVKFRDGKKWKNRSVVLQKPSPVADCLILHVYKGKKKGKSTGHKGSLNVTLEGICGVEPGPGYDGVSFTLSIMCLARTLVLGFSSPDVLLTWDAHIRYSLGEVHRFSVTVEPGTKLESGPASLHLCNDMLVLSRGHPPAIIGHWKLSTLRRYGAVPNGFVFEGGTRCGNWAGVFFLSCSEGEQISFLFDCIVRGVSSSRRLHGLQPNQPDQKADPASAEKRINQETSELEKRLSMLSQCSLASSTVSSASTSSCSTCVAGDDNTMSSSSSSQSDTSYGSRLPFWLELSGRRHISDDTASSSCTLKALTKSDDMLYDALMGGPGSSSTSIQLHPCGLHDSGWQSSLDSGIGITTGSQSLYSGSYSSYTGSLDMANERSGEELGSSISPSTPAHPLSSPVCAPPQTPPTSPFQPICTSGPSSTVISSCSCSPRCVSQASHRHREEYQNPSQLKMWYDTPRTLLQSLSLREPSAHEASPGMDCKSTESQGVSQQQMLNKRQCELKTHHQAMMQGSFFWGSERPPFVYSEGIPISSTVTFPTNLVCGELQVGSTSSQDPFPNHAVDTHDPSDCVRENFPDSGDVGGNLKGLRRVLSSPPRSAPPPPPVTFSVNRPTPAYEEGFPRYPYLNIGTMETAQRQGVKFVQERKDRGTGLESRWRGPPN